MEKSWKSTLPSKRLIGVLIGIFSLYYAGAAIPKRLSYSPTDSVGYHFFFLKYHFDPAELKEGTLVVLPVYTRIRPDCWPCLMVKYIKCVSGQKLNVRNNQFFCDDVFLGTAVFQSKTGMPVEVFQYNGIIPEERIFLMGVTGDSYDSRYVGLENISDVKAIAVPLF